MSDGAERKPIIAICYDFDGTLVPGNMQEYGFIPQLNDPEMQKFWDDSRKFAEENNADRILAYMITMLDKAKDSKVRTTRTAFRGYGRDVRFFDGVEQWFKRINQYGETRGAEIEHYIVSSGLTEFIEGTAIAGEFKKIYACSYCYDQNDAARWPAQVVNFTTKTQYLFRINKDADQDDDKVNSYIPEDERRIPFRRMIYLGDGSTDIPCMRLVKESGGFSIAVHAPGESAEECSRLMKDRRINYFAPADYRDGSKLDEIIKRVIDKIVAVWRVEDAVKTL